MAMPISLDNPEFKAAWAGYVAHRKGMGKRKALTFHAAELRLTKLAQMGSERATEAVNEAVMNGWQGIFAKDDKTPAPGLSFAPPALIDPEARLKAQREREEASAAAVAEDNARRRQQAGAK